MIILASQSIARRTLLSRAGVTYSVVVPPVDEDQIKDRYNGQPQDLASALADAKAMAASRMNPADLIIAADQTLTCAGEHFNKPGDLQTARQQLLALRGKTHRLTSAVSCARGGAITWRTMDHADITFRGFTDEFLNAYLQDCGPDILSSVGAYHYEGQGIQLMEAVTGSDHTILGLPLLPLLTYLRSEGLTPQ